MAKRVALLGFLAAISGAPAAHACSIVIDHEPTYAERRAKAKQIIADASLILDGEVVAAGEDGGVPARIRVQEVLKGSAESFVYVHGDSGACDLSFNRVGERVRLFLFGDPSHYRTSVDDENARHLDRLLKSDRRKAAWPIPFSRAARP
ncbi:MAG: hypothetical protein IIZ38_09370 [Sphingomonas sp.]|uniref:hypothetical protein n=1 Tax=unclassified Sphingomonas TaxID=196159 RepID=UPI002454C494|nr:MULTISPECIES: hypothetical protein [unclassified Sphingomonas]MBQ1498512.1 hypothetical protein [Sphingomonas sp.]MDH4744285.1 hypothetical protein [Sphingomonas sp. CBMAI 2297]